MKLENTKKAIALISDLEDAKNLIDMWGKELRPHAIPSKTQVRVLLPSIR